MLSRMAGKTSGQWRNQLYYGDNLNVLRDHDRIPSESIDLVYLDPPFNSSRAYNVLFAERTGEDSAAQIEAASGWSVSLASPTSLR
jgi:16S rRNA G966 N2-methylase RsmD